MKSFSRIVALTFLLPAAVSAQITEWTNSGTGNFGTAGNWSAGVPDSGSTARVTNGGTAVITDSQQAGGLFIGTSPSSSGFVEVASGGSLAFASTLSVAGGSASTGLLAVRSGTVTSNSAGVIALGIGSGAGASGTAVISNGGAFSMAAGVALGTEGFGVLQIGEGGAAGTLTADSIRGGQFGGSGQVIFNHNEAAYSFGTRIGSSNAGSVISVIHNGPGVTTLSNGNSAYTAGTFFNNGVLAVSENNNLGDASSALVFNGGTLRATLGFTMNRSGTLNSAGTIEVTSGTLTQQGSFSGSGGLIKIGTGGLTLTGSNSYSAGTTVKAGVLTVSGGSVTPRWGRLSSAIRAATMERSCSGPAGFSPARMSPSGGLRAALAGSRCLVPDRF